MSQWSYVAAAWVLVALTLCSYALTVLARGKKLSTRVPLSRRRWSDTEDPTGG